MTLYLKPRRHILRLASSRFAGFGAGLQKHFYPVIIGIVFLLVFADQAQAQVATTHGVVDSQKPIKNPKIVISGKIQETTDFFGRKRFIGKVVNKEKERIDFIKIEFTLRNREGKVLETTAVYIKGQRHMFYNRQVSTSSLGPGKTGTFNIITSIPAENVFSYTYKITGKHFIYP